MADSPWVRRVMREIAEAIHEPHYQCITRRGEPRMIAVTCGKCWDHGILPSWPWTRYAHEDGTWLKARKAAEQHKTETLVAALAKHGLDLRALLREKEE